MDRPELMLLPIDDKQAPALLWRLPLSFGPIFSPLRSPGREAARRHRIRLPIPLIRLPSPKPYTFFYFFFDGPYSCSLRYRIQGMSVGPNTGTTGFQAARRPEHRHNGPAACTAGFQLAQRPGQLAQPVFSLHSRISACTAARAACTASRQLAQRPGSLHNRFFSLFYRCAPVFTAVHLFLPLCCLLFPLCSPFSRCASSFPAVQISRRH